MTSYLYYRCHYKLKFKNKCGLNRIICIDDTHGTNSYDVHLTTVVFVDEFGEGYPTAWCLSNRTDCGTLVHFFQAIKKYLGLNIMLMTDDAEQFYTACLVKDLTKPLCTWHVDRAWRGAVKNKIQEK